MNNSSSLQQMHKPGNLDSNLISRQYKLNLMTKFMQINFENSKLTQSQTANQLGYSSSTLKRYRNDKMVSTYRIQSNTTNKRSKKVSNTNIDNNSHCEHEHKRAQMSPKDPK